MRLAFQQPPAIARGLRLLIAILEVSPADFVD